MSVIAVWAVELVLFARSIAGTKGFLGRARRQPREAIAEENRKEIIERLWKGRAERVRRGLPPGGNTPYGYQRKAKWLVVAQMRPRP